MFFSRFSLFFFVFSDHRYIFSNIGSIVYFWTERFDTAVIIIILCSICLVSRSHAMILLFLSLSLSLTLSLSLPLSERTSQSIDRSFVRSFVQFNYLIYLYSFPSTATSRYSDFYNIDISVYRASIKF